MRSDVRHSRPKPLPGLYQAYNIINVEGLTEQCNVSRDFVKLLRLAERPIGFAIGSYGRTEMAGVSTNPMSPMATYLSNNPPQNNVRILHLKRDNYHPMYDVMHMLHLKTGHCLP